MSFKEFANNTLFDEVMPEIGVSPRELFDGNLHAYELMLMFAHISNIWDDMIDGDPVDKNLINYAFEASLIDMEMNPVYRMYQREFLAIKTTAILSFHAANTYEATLDEHGLELGHTLRYSIANAVIYLVFLCKGMNYAKQITPSLMKMLCGERINDYITEIKSRGTV